MVPRRLKTLALASGAAMLPAVAFAGAPVAYESTYTINADGTINYTCPATFTCSAAPINEAGFFQTQISDGVNTYFHSIVAENTAAGVDPSSKFLNESFVMMGAPGNGGIAGYQYLDENGVAASSGYIQTDMTLATGAFNNGAEAYVNLTQYVSNVKPDATLGIVPNFDTTFTLVQADNGAGEKVNTVYLDQNLTGVDGTGATDFTDSFVFNQQEMLASATNPTDVILGKEIMLNSGIKLNDTGTTNDQTFAYKYSTGVYTQAGSRTLGNGAVVDWIDGDTVDAVLIGQTVTNAGVFGYERWRDLTNLGALDVATPTESASWVSLTSLPAAMSPF